MEFNNYISEIVNAIKNIFGVIIGIIFGSIWTYRIDLAKKRDKENDELLKNIYFKIYLELNNYISNQYAYRGGWSGKKPISFMKIKKHLEDLMEKNMDIIDTRLFSLYLKIKSEQYFDDNLYGDDENRKYLNFYASLISYMIKTLKKSKMSNKKPFIKKVEELFYEYKVRFLLSNKMLDFDNVENILIMSFNFKRTYKTIAKSSFIENLCNNDKIDNDEFNEIFNKYCNKEIVFPIFNKYFWKR